MVAMGDPPRALRASRLRVPWARRELNPHTGPGSSTVNTVSVAIALSFVVSLAVPLTACGGGGQPAAAPVAGKIAFESNRDGNFEIHIMNADGSGQTQITTDPAGAVAPTWTS